MAVREAVDDGDRQLAAVGLLEPGLDAPLQRACAPIASYA